MRALLTVVMSVALAVLHSFAQSIETASPLVPDRGYKVLKEDEDWSFLRDTSLREDFWDPIKYIPIRNDGDWFLTIGGEAREVWEQIGNDNWGQAPYTNGYFNQRYMLHFDVRYGKRLRTFVELKSGLNSFRREVPAPLMKRNSTFRQLSWN